MPMHIHTEPRLRHFIDEAVAMPEDQRQFIEDAKAAERVDDVLLDACHLHKQRHAGLENNLDPDEEQQFLAEIRDTFDAAIAALGICRDVEDIERVKQLATSLGRKYARPVKVNVQELHPRLKAVFQEIDQRYQLHRSGVDDKTIIRRKIAAAIQIVNDALANRKTG